MRYLTARKEVSGGKLRRADYKLERTKAEAYLSELGLCKEFIAHWRLIWSVLSVFGLVAVVAVFANDGDQSRIEWVISAIVAAGLLIGGYFEWTLARREASLDKFYERLCIANDSNEKLNAAELTKGDVVSLKNTTLQLYVYREIDNLEYVLQRYRHGFLDPVLAARGVATFASRLKVPDFVTALRLLGDLSDKAGYLHTTGALVRALLLKAAPQQSPTRVGVSVATAAPASPNPDAPVGAAPRGKDAASPGIGESKM